MKLKFILLLFFASAAVGALAQKNGIVAGKITDARSNTVLPGVTVATGKNGAGKTTDVEGRFQFSLPAGTHTLTFSAVGYQSKSITNIVLAVGSVKEVNVMLEPQIGEMDAVVVTASARMESVASVLSMQRNNASISDGISSEAIKKSPDKNIGEVLKRVSGTSIQDDKFVIVRGLNDRYNTALINGAILPSTEPDRRAFSFDIVPSSMIDNIVINKTASPNLPGDFSGGLIQIQTKDIPFKSFFSVSMGTSYNSLSTGKAFKIGQLRNADYLGYDDGTRLLPQNFPGRNRYLSFNADATPERRLAASRLMRNNYGERYSGDALPGLHFQATWGGRQSLKNGGTIGSIVAVTYRNAQNIAHNIRRDYQTPNEISVAPGNLFFDYRDTTYTFSTNIGLLANTAYKKGSNKIVLKNIVNRTFDISNLHRSGYNYDNRQYVNVAGIVPIIKSLISSQLEGDHIVDERNSRLNWNINYALTARNQPDYRVLPYAKNIDELSDKSTDFKIVLRDTYRFWSDLYDNAFGGQLNYTWPVTFFNQKQQLKAGLMGQYKLRDFSTRIFRYEQATATLHPLLISMPARTIFNDGNIYEQGFVLSEITNNTDRYDATSGLYAAYAMMDGSFSDKMRAVYGVRVEHFGFTVNTADFSGQKVAVVRRYLDVLPSLNLTYKLTNSSNLRFSASRTVSRPEFREAANFAYYDFVRNAQIKGNTDIERSQNTNLDFRFETYPTGGEMISASLFYKHFNKPIEQVVVNGSSPGNLILSFTNPAAATLYGVEAEMRKNFVFVGDAPWLESLFFTMNAAYMQSRVHFTQSSNAFDPERPLQGQSPWLLNAGLQYALPDNQISFSALVNRIGPRIAAVGFQGYPDIYENGRTVLDFQAAVKVLKSKGEVKLNLSDLLNQRAIFYQNVDAADKKSYNKSSDRVQYDYLYGSNISVGFTYNFL